MRSQPGSDGSEEQGLPEGFVARLYEAWAPGLPHLTEGRFLPGFRVYLDQRQAGGVGGAWGRWGGLGEWGVEGKGGVGS